MKNKEFSSSFYWIWNINSCIWAFTTFHMVSRTVEHTHWTNTANGHGKRPSIDRINRQQQWTNTRKQTPEQEHWAITVDRDGKQAQWRGKGCSKRWTSSENYLQWKHRDRSCVQWICTKWVYSLCPFTVYLHYFCLLCLSTGSIHCFWTFFLSVYYVC